jgi:hypothetical protein
MYAWAEAVDLRFKDEFWIDRRVQESAGAASRNMRTSIESTSAMPNSVLPARSRLQGVLYMTSLTSLPPHDEVLTTAEQWKAAMNEKSWL